MGKPLLLLDVDGVLIPYAAPEQPAGFQQHVLQGEQVWLAPHHGAWLRPLCDRFQLVWATGWEHEANRLIAPILGLPELPVIEFERDVWGRFSKLPTLARFAAGRPLVWIDDELTDAARAWAAGRAAPTLLLDADPATGLTEQLVAAMAAFLNDSICSPGSSLQPPAY
ncbi:MAG TPA: HAD domain-containing protein [Roseiflexaceae bacterium]|nr:HAD domain-containing protein [Roseiflexaceae bacterium]